MSLPAWPASVPHVPLTQGWNVAELAAPPLATGMEDGPERMRRRVTARWSTINLQWRMTAVQYANFRNFFATSLADGASRFTMPVWAPGRVHPLPVRTCFIVPGSVRVSLLTTRHALVSATLKVLDDA